MEPQAAQNRTLRFPQTSLKLYYLLPACVMVFMTSFGSAYYGFKELTKKDMTAPYTVKTELTQQLESKNTAVCPLNGAYYTENQKDVWQKRRPLGVMIENHTEARPQSGIQQADIVYEVVAEGGITRFLAVFLCQEPEVIGPVRSARTYFLDFISEYDGLYTHVGGANTPGPADALGQIQRYGIRDLDHTAEIASAFKRDQNRLNSGIATEHTMFVTTAKLWDLAESKFGWGAEDAKTKARWDEDFVTWQFAEDTPQTASSSAVITIPFWEKGVGQYTAKWNYDKSSNSYRRDNGGKPHIDALTNEQLTAKNIVIQFATEERANDGYPGNQHLLYGTIGSGEAWIFQNGTVIKGSWKKNNRLSRTKFFDLKGQEIQFVRGKIWVTMVPTHNKDTIKVGALVL